MRWSDAGLFAFPVLLVVMFVGSAWSESRERDYEEWREEYRMPDGGFSEEFWAEENARSNYASQPSTVAWWISLGLMAFALADLCWRYASHRTPAWWNGRVAANWVGILVGASVLVGLEARRWSLFGEENVVGTMSGVLVAWAIYGSIWCGLFVADRLRDGSSRAVRLGLGWMLGLTFLWPALCIAVLIPDWSSNDLLALAVPALAIGAMGSTILLVLTGQSRIPHPLAGMEEAP